MGKDNAFLGNASSYFDKLMRKTYVEKSDLLSLKKQLTVLKERESTYNPILNSITRIANEAKGKNPVDVLREVYLDFQAISNASSYFDMIMKETAVNKESLLLLTGKFEVLKKRHEKKYASVCDSIVAVTNRAQNKNSITILNRVYADFKAIRGM